MEPPQPLQPLIRYQATPLEWRALNRALWIFSLFLKDHPAIFSDPCQRKLIIAQCNSFLLRPKRMANNVICCEASRAEAEAISQIIRHYSRIVTLSLPASAEELPWKRRIEALQDRVVDSWLL